MQNRQISNSNFQTIKIFQNVLTQSSLDFDSGYNRFYLELRRLILQKLGVTI